MCIVKPAEEFRRNRVDLVLVKALKHRPQAASPRDRDSQRHCASGAVLSFLQLVCKELWQSRRPGENHLSFFSAAYTAIGRRYGTPFSAMSTGRRPTLTPLQREDAASVLTWLSLLRSGVKQAFDASQLSEIRAWRLK